MAGRSPRIDGTDMLALIEQTGIHTHGQPPVVLGDTWALGQRLLSFARRVSIIHYNKTGI